MTATIDGVTRSIAEWIELMGFKSRHTVYKRINSGWTVTDAITTPAGERR